MDIIFWAWTVNPGKCILRNLFLGFISEEEQAHSRRMLAATVSSLRTTSSNLSRTMVTVTATVAGASDPATRRVL